MKKLIRLFIVAVLLAASFASGNVTAPLVALPVALRTEQSFTIDAKDGALAVLVYGETAVVVPAAEAWAALGDPSLLWVVLVETAGPPAEALVIIDLPHVAIRLRATAAISFRLIDFRRPEQPQDEQA